MLLRAYGRSVFVYKMYQVSFPRAVGAASEGPKTSIIDKSNLRSDSRCYSLIIYRTTSNESMLAIYSHLLPIQPSRASSLLPSLLGGTYSQTRWVTPTISTAVIDFFAYKPGSVHFRRYCEPYGRWLCHSFVVFGF